MLYMSGYTGLSHRDLLSGEANLLAKPFTRESLLAKLSDVLAVDRWIPAKRDPGREPSRPLSAQKQTKVHLPTGCLQMIFPFRKK